MGAAELGDGATLSHPSPRAFRMLHGTCPTDGWVNHPSPFQHLKVIMGRDRARPLPTLEGRDGEGHGPDSTPPSLLSEASAPDGSVAPQLADSTGMDMLIYVHIDMAVHPCIEMSMCIWMCMKMRMDFVQTCV